MLAISGEISQVQKDLSQDWEAMAKKARSLFGASWTGSAAESYGEPWEECSTGFDNVLQSLDDMTRALASAPHQYQTQENETRQVLRTAGAPVSLNLDV